MKLNIYTVPNLLSAARVVLIPFVVWGIVDGGSIGAFMALALTSISEIFDLTDGYIARKTGVVSDIGKLLDPLADTLFHVSIYMAFLAVGVVDLWMVILLFCCTICVAYYRTVAASFGFVMAARPWGKIKANFQAYGAILIIIMLAYRSLVALPPGPGVKAVLFGIMAATFLGIVIFFVVFRIRERPLLTATISALVVCGLALFMLYQHSIPLDVERWSFYAMLLVTGMTLWSFIDYSRFFVAALLDWERRDNQPLA